MLTRRRSRSDAALRWWGSLNRQPPVIPRPRRALAAVLVVAATTAAAAMPLVWHHLTVPNPAYYGPPTVEVIHGSDTANWLSAVAAVSLYLAIRSLRDAPGPASTWAITVLAALTLNGMFIDDFDWSRRGVSLYVPAYFGPGFYVGLSCAGVLVVAAVIAWRARS